MVARAMVLFEKKISLFDKKNRFCLRLKVMVGKATDFVCHKQCFLLEQPVLSSMDSYGW